jgi:hypothetical protein
MRRREFIAAGYLALALASTATAQVVTPQPGTPLRAEVLNGFRPTVEAEIGAPVEFVVTVIHVMGTWAFVSVRPQRPGGTPIDWRNTKFRQAYESDTMSDLALGLLRRSGPRWSVVEYAIGPTDVIWYEWMKTHRLPEQLFLE